ncbi:MAG: hypothetical protein ABFD44_12180 [Anaerolineaceae bacterium]
MIEAKRFSLVKPTTQTPFHIDFDWWKQHDNNWHVYLRGCLCEEHRKSFENAPSDVMIDWIDPETARVTRLDGLQLTLINHCAQQPDFITPHTTLVDAIFRSFIASKNFPASPAELSEKLGRPAETILRTIAGPTIYRGLRPFNG